MLSNEEKGDDLFYKNGNKDMENIADASRQGLRKIDTELKALETREAKDMSRGLGQEIRDTIREMGTNIDQNVVDLLEKILDRLVKTDRVNYLDQLRNKANRENTEHTAFAFFVMAVSVALILAYWGTEDQQYIPLVLLFVSGSLILLSVSLKRIAMRRAEKEDNPERHPAFTSDPWYSLFRFEYWVWLFGRSKCILVSTLLLLIVPITMVVVLFLAIKLVFELPS